MARPRNDGTPSATPGKTLGEIQRENVEIREDEQERATPKAGRRQERIDRVSAERGPLNHATAPSENREIAGMKFNRRRGSLDHSTNTELDIPKDVLNNGLEYRWVNDANNRVEKLRQRDYEIVPEGSLGEKVSTRRRVGTNKDGSAKFAQLMAIPKEWYAENQSKREETRTAHETRLSTKPHDEGGELGKEFYKKDVPLR